MRIGGILCLILVSQLAFGWVQILDDDMATTLDGVRYVFQKDTAINYYPDGSIQSGELRDSVTVRYNGFDTVLEKGEIRFYNNGQVFEATLAQDTSQKVGGNPVDFRGGSKMVFYDDKTVRQGVLNRDLEAAYPEGSYRFLAGTEMSFYKNGFINSGEFAIDQFVKIGPENVRFKRVSFSPSNRIVSGILREDSQVTVGGIKALFKLGTQIDLFENGSVKSGVLKGKRQWLIHNQSITIAGDEPVTEFTPDGKLLRGMLAEDAAIVVDGNLQRLNRGVEVILTPDGDLFAMKLRMDCFYIWNGKRKKIDSDRYVVFQDFRRNEISAVGDWNYKFRFPPRVFFAEPTVVWVRYKVFTIDPELLKIRKLKFDPPREDIIEEMMFIQETTVWIDGSVKICPAFEWIPIYQE